MRQRQPWPSRYEPFALLYSVMVLQPYEQFGRYVLFRDIWRKFRLNTTVYDPRMRDSTELVPNFSMDRIRVRRESTHCLQDPITLFPKRVFSP